MNIACIAAGLACLLYYGVIAVYAGPTANFAWFWIAVGSALLLAAFLYRFDAPAPVWCRRAILAVLGLGFAAVALISIPVLRGMHAEQDAQPAYAIVLGAQVRGSVPSRALRRRLEKAAEYAEQNPAVTLILSGGQGEGEEISEAQCMWEYLTAAGIPEERLILEDASTSTRENLVFSDEKTGCAAKACGILSNDFHIFRAVRIARKVGYTEPVGLPARSDPVMQLHYVVRETVALAVEKIKGEI